ncbi:hypothetical protein KIPB_003324 [Kipferlia bialata]|uniref:Uncharacterized protein n=1 Tax=Kipferlia bialata TaxID=797122 RepID=A0A9K3CU95_9EUKA|nr:hypothetical protein KIPB_003324 [Kipferlia bialata]|eukprot:g3324.t1
MSDETVTDTPLATPVTQTPAVDAGQEAPEEVEKVPMIIPEDSPFEFLNPALSSLTLPPLTARHSLSMKLESGPAKGQKAIKGLGVSAESVTTGVGGDGTMVIKEGKSVWLVTAPDVQTVHEIDRAIKAAQAEDSAHPSPYDTEHVVSVTGNGGTGGVFKCDTSGDVTVDAVCTLSVYDPSVCHSIYTLMQTQTQTQQGAEGGDGSAPLPPPTPYAPMSVPPVMQQRLTLTDVAAQAPPDASGSESLVRRLLSSCEGVSVSGSGLVVTAFVPLDMVSPILLGDDPSGLTLPRCGCMCSVRVEKWVRRQRPRPPVVVPDMGGAVQQATELVAMAGPLAQLLQTLREMAQAGEGLTSTASAVHTLVESTTHVTEAVDQTQSTLSTLGGVVTEVGEAAERLKGLREEREREEGEYRREREETLAHREREREREAKLAETAPTPSAPSAPSKQGANVDAYKTALLKLKRVVNELKGSLAQKDRQVKKALADKEELQTQVTALQQTLTQGGDEQTQELMARIQQLEERDAVHKQQAEEREREWGVEREALTERLKQMDTEMQREKDRQVSARIEAERVAQALRALEAEREREAQRQAEQEAEEERVRQVAEDAVRQAEAEAERERERQAQLEKEREEVLRLAEKERERKRLAEAERERQAELEAERERERLREESEEVEAEEFNPLGAPIPSYPEREREREAEVETQVEREREHQREDKVLDLLGDLLGTAPKAEADGGVEAEAEAEEVPPAEAEVEAPVPAAEPVSIADLVVPQDKASTPSAPVPLVSDPLAGVDVEGEGEGEGSSDGSSFSESSDDMGQGVAMDPLALAEGDGEEVEFDPLAYIANM